jgi:hypothetical protein
MKKHLLIAAVAATMTTSVIADISITGNGKFEYFNVDTDNVSENKTNTEVNLGIKGKSGDTTVVLNLEFSTQGSDGVDVEDMYLTTKVGEASIKAGNYTTSTSAILGEIDNGGRANNKVTISTVYNGVKVYGGNVGSKGEGATDIDNSMFLGVSAKVGGVTVQAKRNSATINSFAVSGSMAGFDARLETKLNDADDSDVVFGSVAKKVSGVTLGVAWIDADRDGLISENDSAIFAVENGNVSANVDLQKKDENGNPVYLDVNGKETTTTTKTLVMTSSHGNSNMQVSAKKDMSGNIVTVKAGKIGYDDDKLDLDYTQLAVSRALASGTTLVLSYTNENATKEIKTFEADISVKF